MRTMSPALQTLLDAATDRVNWASILSNAMGSSRRLRCKRDAAAGAADAWATGTEFINVALAGNFSYDYATGVVNSFGATYDATVRQAANLATGTSVFRIEGNGYYIQGTVGLVGSGADYEMRISPTATSGISVELASIYPPSALALPNPGDGTPPTVSLDTSASSVTTASGLILTATASDDGSISKVEFYRGGSLIATSYTAPYQHTDSITYLFNGTLTYTARAYDAANNNTLSSAKVVTVNIDAPLETGDPVAIGSAITTMTVDNTSASTATNVPVTFGQVFKVGQLPLSGAGVELRRADNSIISAQLDVKASHPDGSVRHALISAIIPSMTASQSLPLSIVRANPPASTTPITAAAAIAAGLNATVSITDASGEYTVSLATLLAGTATTWVSGNVASEWIVSGPLKRADNAEHPFLHARFTARMYGTSNTAKIDVCIENSWVIPDPLSVSGGNAWTNNSPAHSITYDVVVTVAGDAGYSQVGLIHFNKARWIKTFWWNSASVAHVRHNAAYILSTKALPNYDLAVASTSKIASFNTTYQANKEPMKSGIMMPGQGNAGSRSDIGLNPGWCVVWLMTGDKTAKEFSVGTSYLAGSYNVHYRNKATDRWVDIRDYPYACLSIGSASDDLNPATGKHEKVPVPTGSTGNPNIPNGYHQPNMSYIPYLLTGDFFHLDEMQAWTEWDVLQLNPAYRFHGQGIVKQGEPRYRAWLLRTVANTAYISPDGDPIKARATAATNATLDYFVSRHITSPVGDSGNIFGLMHDPAGGCNALLYKNLGNTGTTTLVGAASYQADHILTSVGMCVELGFVKAQPLLNWMANYQANRLTNSDYCWVLGALYSLDMRATSSGPFYTTWAEVYAATVPAAIRATACGSQAMADAISTLYSPPYVINQMPPYSANDLDGYCNILQAATAYVQMSNHPQKENAWLVINARAVKPTFADPVFAIIPR